MSEAAPDPDEEMLARLAAFDLAAAERVHGRLMAAEETAEIAELGRTYQRIARSLRQTLALKAKLKHDRASAAKAAAAEPAPPASTGPAATARRARELRQAVTRVIWNEAEDADFATDLEECLDQHIAHGVLRDGFCAESLDDHVVRLCMTLDLPLEDAERWRDLPDPDAGEPDIADDPARRSSA